MMEQNNYGETPVVGVQQTKEPFYKQKKFLIVAGVVVAFIVIFALFSGDDVITRVQEITFEGDADTVGEIIEDSIDSPKWKVEDEDGDSAEVSVKGYSDLYEEDIKITFSYEEDGDEYEVALECIEFLDSDEESTDDFEMYLLWQALYLEN